LLFFVQENNKVIKLDENINSSISVKQILSDNWSEYSLFHSVTSYQFKEVEKALKCYDIKNGCFVYYCANCDKYLFMTMGCNSRICSCCGKRYTDQWAHSLSKAMFNVSHRHFVMSVPDILWTFLKSWEIRKIYMDAAIRSFNDYFSKILRRKINVGVIVILHPFGKDMKEQPHLHLLITEGGFDINKKFVKCKFIPADGFRINWQYHAITIFQENGLPNEIGSFCFKQYPNGFYVWLHKRGRIKNRKLISKYVGRYVRHPAIANSRIYYYDKKIVKFYYINNEESRINVEMCVNDFITALIQHIPPPQFKMIRYYGAYARRSKRKFGAAIQSGIKQLNLYKFGLERIKTCPFCKKELTFVWYLKKAPPEILKIQKELTIYLD
jgi:hypothetical protein